MNDQEKRHASSFRRSITSDRLRPAVLLFGTQIVISLLASVVLTNGLLA